MSTGSFDTLTVSFINEDNIDFTFKWSSSDENIVSVDTNVNITAIKTGTATISCSSIDKYGCITSASCIVTVISCDETDSHEHIWSDWTVITAPTTLTQGKEE